MSKIIELQNVNKWFDKFQALKDVSLEVNQQEKIVICGPSGSGKVYFNKMYKSIGRTSRRKNNC